MNKYYPCPMPFQRLYLVPRERLDFRFCPYHECNLVNFVSSKPLELEKLFNTDPETLRRREAFLNHDFQAAGCKEDCLALSSFQTTGKQYCLDDYEVKNKFKIKQIWLSMSPDCNIKCRYCLDLPPNQIAYNTCPPKFLELAGDFVSTGGNLLLTGGEPFIPKWGLNRVLQKLGENQNDQMGKIFLQTNGTFLNEATRKLILASPVYVVGVSFDTCRPYLFNYLRRGSSYHEVLKNVLALRDEAKMEDNTRLEKIVILCAVLKLTAPYIRETVDFFYNEGFQIDLNNLHVAVYSPKFSTEQGLHNLSDIALERLYNDILYIQEKYNDSDRIQISGLRGQVEVIRSYRQKKINYQVNLTMRNDLQQVQKDDKSKEKRDVKIFVSHRIDLESDTINNPFFYPIRCGAVLDKRENKPDIMGDDTGENISEKRNSYCELTVLYWAWKNVKADYYGLCHYRRYLSFSDRNFEIDNKGCVVESFLDKYVMDQYKINTDTIASLVEQYDIITAQPVDTLKASGDNTVRENWCNHPYVYNKNDLDEVDKIIKTMYPDFVEDFNNYLNSRNLYWYNCFIMKRELFFDYCKWLFSILFELEKRIDTTYYSREKKRVYGVIGERLYGTFILHIKRTSKIKIIEKQLVFIENPRKFIIPEPCAEINNIPILLISNNAYVPILGVFISSVLSHASKNYNYDFIVLQNDISQDNQRLLNSIILNYTKGGINSNMQFLTPYKREFINLNTNDKRFLDLMNYRLFAPWILGSKYKKALVMDTDIIVKSNIADLFNEDISDYWAGCVLDVVYQGMLNKNENEYYKYTKNTLGLEEPYNYVNAGVKLLNLEKIRNELSEEDIIMLISGNKYRIDEQDVFNSVFAGRIKFIDLKYNYPVAVNWFVKDKLFCTPLKSIELYESCKNPAVIHWANTTKPWFDLEIPFAHEFWEVARNTPFYELIIKRMVSGSSIDRIQITDNKIQKGSFKRIIKPTIKKILSPFFPPRSKRRETLKKIYRKFRNR